MVGGLTLDQGVMGEEGFPIGTLVNMCNAVAVGPPLFLAQRGLRRGCVYLQCLHARREILDGLGQLDGDFIGVDAPSVDGVHGGDEFQLARLEGLDFREQ